MGVTNKRLSVSRHLIIGLGRCGHQILIELRRRIADSYGDLNALPWVRFLAIDTDAYTFHDPAVEPSMRLPSEMMVHAAIDYGQAYHLKREPELSPNIMEWLDQRVLQESYDQGTRRIRPLGRLAFFQNYPTISEKLSLGIAYLTAQDLDLVQLESQQVLISPDLIIFIIGSLAGGTGGGMFLDIAYLIREQLQYRRLKPTDLSGIFLLPPNSGADDGLATANSYAALRELNHYCHPETTFSAKYNPVVNRINTNAIPFDRFYLLEPDINQISSSVAGSVIDLVRERLFLEITSECGAAVRAVYRNLPLKALDAQDCPSCYCSFGVAALLLSPKKLADICAARLAQAAVRRWVEDEAERSLEIEKAFATQRLQAERLDINSIREDLRLGGKPTEQTFESALVNRCQEIQTHAQKMTESEARAYLNAAKGQLAYWVENISQQPADAEAQSLMRRGIEALHRFKRSYPFGCKSSIGSAGGFFKGLGETLRFYIKTLEGEIDEAEKHLARMARYLEDAPAMKSWNKGFIGIFKAHKRYVAIIDFVATMQSYYQTTHERTINSSALHCYREFVKELESIEKEVWESFPVMESLTTKWKGFKKALVEPTRADDGDELWLERALESFYRQQIGEKDEAYIVEEMLKKLSFIEGLDRLTTIEGTKAYNSLLATAQSHLRKKNSLSVLSLLFEQNDFGNALSIMQKLAQDAQPRLGLTLSPTSGSIFKQGFACLSDSEHQSYIKDMILDEKLRHDSADVHWVGISDTYRAYMLFEYAGFPLSALSALDIYEDAYIKLARTEQTLLHTRVDVEWNSIKPKSLRDGGGAHPVRSISELVIGGGSILATTDNLSSLDVDAIVCFRHRSLKESGLVAANFYESIRRHGGAEIDAEAGRYGPLKFGAICVTTGGRLRAEHVVHVATIDDIEATSLTEQNLRDAIKAIFDESERQNWLSIGIPIPIIAMGTLSQDVCISIIFKETCQCLAKGAVALQSVVLSTPAPEELSKIITLMTEQKARGRESGKLVIPQPDEEPIEYSQRFLYAMECKFPNRISRAIYDLRGIVNPTEMSKQLENVLELTLEHLSNIALVEYLSGEARDEKLNEMLLETFRRSLPIGTWAKVLREVLTFLRDHKTAEETFISELSELYFQTRGTPRAMSLQPLVEKVITLRNDLVHSNEIPSQAQHQLFKRVMIELLQTLAFMKDYQIISEKNSHIEKEIKTHVCNLHMGFHDTFEQIEIQCDLDLEQGQVMLLKPSTNELLSMYPFCLLRTCPEKECRAQHLFYFNKINNRRIEFLGSGGHILRDANAYADLKMMLDRPASRKLRYKANYLYLFPSLLESWGQVPDGRIINHKYQIVEHLRRGGMADVYRVKNIENNEDLALKLLPFQFISNRTIVTRFRQEASQATNLSHKNITRILDYGEELADHYLVMELASGWRASNGTVALNVGELPRPLDEEATISIIGQICEGLIYIHDKGIIHRDIKPGNMLLFEGGKVKLADFGIARFRESVTLTMTGLSIGTPEYMSPEQAEGMKGLTQATDIYSLGVVMYELLTGELPFKRNRPFATALAHLYDPVPDPRSAQPAISNRMSSIVMKCLLKSSAKRYQSARELFQSLT